MTGPSSHLPKRRVSSCSLLQRALRNLPMSMDVPQRETIPPGIPCDVVYAGREVCGDLAAASAREFLVTNNKGGYASATLTAGLTRSYHGLLIAALRPPLDRTLLLAKLNETVEYRGRKFCLGTDTRSVSKDIGAQSGDRSWGRRNSAADVFDGSSQSEVVSPTGFEYLESFRLEGGVPVFSYALGDSLLEKRVWMASGENTVYVTYHLHRATEGIEIQLMCLLNHRNHHHRTSAERPHFDYSANVSSAGDSVLVVFTTCGSQKTTLRMKVDHGHAELANEWVTGFVLREERARGLPDLDDNLHAATFHVDLPPGGYVTFVATAEPDSSDINTNGEAELSCHHQHEAELLMCFQEARVIALKRRRAVEGRRRSLSMPGQSIKRNLSMSAPSKCDISRASVEPCILQLVLAANQFVISRAGGSSLVAGYHWFTDWARDVSYSLNSGLLRANVFKCEILSERLKLRLLLLLTSLETNMYFRQ